MKNSYFYHSVKISEGYLLASEGAHQVYWSSELHLYIPQQLLAILINSEKEYLKCLTLLLGEYPVS